MSEAGQTVAAFAAGLKDAVDLDSVRGDLARTVHQALEPAHISMWIRLLLRLAIHPSGGPLATAKIYGTGLSR